MTNGIGAFAIGQSALGDPPFDWQATVLSQYANSPTLLALIGSFSSAIDPTQLLDLFYDQVWNIETAQGWGLDVWGRIVGVDRVLLVTTQVFGFNEAKDPSEVGWNQAPFYSGQTLTSNYALTDDAFRQLILAKAAANISDCSIPSINAILRTLFGQSGVCYCVDGGDMTMQYVFEFQLTPLQISIIETAGVLPKPAGVSVSIVQG